MKLRVESERPDRASPTDLRASLRDDKMPAYNTMFKPSIKDMDLIETALRSAQASKTAGDARSINDLLSRLHNQKIFFRPREGTYVSG